MDDTRIMQALSLIDDARTLVDELRDERESNRLAAAQLSLDAATAHLAILKAGL